MLGALETRHAKDPVAIIGVHSAKFSNEKDPAHILAAMRRYGVRHPVVVDSDMAIWNRYGIEAWPTVVLIRPNGRIAAVVPGEPDPAALENAVEEILAEARADGTAAAGPVLKEAPPPPDTGPLAYPGKVLVAPDGRIFVSDTGHHRVLVLRAHGRFMEQIGSGLQGRRDGGFGEAALDEPEGLALDGRFLYIADARRHVIVRADLAAHTVTTIAGTGKLGESPLPDEPVPALGFALRSPWDLALDGQRLLFAAAGSHQIGVIDLDAGTVAVFAGNGNEALADGGPDDASFAQPSGLALAGDSLYVADSESSAVRVVDMATRATSTLTGTGLFDWSDGTGAAAGHALLQHPLAVAVAPLGLVVADTYNSKLKRFGADHSRIEALPSIAGGLPLWEPGGLAVAPDGSVVVADTNRSRILRLDAAGRTLSVIPVRGVPEASAGIAIRAVETPHAERETAPSVDLGSARVPPGGPLALALRAPDGFQFSAGAPVEVAARGGRGVRAGSRVSQEASGGAIESVRLPVAVSSTGALTFEVRTDVCDARTHRACYPVDAHFHVTLQPGPGGTPVTVPLAVPKG